MTLPLQQGVAGDSETVRENGETTAAVHSVPLQTAGAPALPAGTVAHRILVVDDSPGVFETMASIIELWDFEVQTAMDGVSALMLLETFSPNVVLCDIGLPAMDGYEIARRIRQRPGGESLKLIAVSGYAMEEDVRRSSAAGFNTHLAKPVEPETLHTLLMPE